MTANPRITRRIRFPRCVGVLNGTPSQESAAPARWSPPPLPSVVSARQPLWEVPTVTDRPIVSIIRAGRGR